MRKEKKEAEATLTSFLSNFRFYEDLLAAWPEGKELVQPYLDEAKGSKPATPLVDLSKVNALLGLPKGA
jgi:hypothetical protein